MPYLDQLGPAQSEKYFPPVNQLALYIPSSQLRWSEGRSKVLVLFINMWEGYYTGGRFKDSQVRTHVQTTRELHDLNVYLASFDNGFKKLCAHVHCTYARMAYRC